MCNKAQRKTKRSRYQVLLLVCSVAFQGCKKRQSRGVPAVLKTGMRVLLCFAIQPSGAEPPFVLLLSCYCTAPGMGVRGLSSYVSGCQRSCSEHVDLNAGANDDASTANVS